MNKNNENYLVSDNKFCCLVSLDSTKKLFFAIKDDDICYVAIINDD